MSLLMCLSASMSSILARASDTWHCDLSGIACCAGVLAFMHVCVCAPAQTKNVSKPSSDQVALPRGATTSRGGQGGVACGCYTHWPHLHPLALSAAFRLLVQDLVDHDDACVSHTTGMHKDGVAAQQPPSPAPTLVSLVLSTPLRIQSHGQQADGPGAPSHTPCRQGVHPHSVCACHTSGCRVSEQGAQSKGFRARGSEGTEPVGRLDPSCMQHLSGSLGLRLGLQASGFFLWLFGGGAGPSPP